MKTRLYFGLLILVLSVFFVIPAASAACDLTGTWNMGLSGHLDLTQSGNNVQGVWSQAAASDALPKDPQSGNNVQGALEPMWAERIDGTLVGNTFTGRWSGGKSFPPPRDAGGLIITVSDDCMSFTATWGYDQSSTGNPVKGARISGSTGSTTAQPTKKGCTGSGTSIYVDDRTMNPGQEVVIPIMMCNANDIANMDLSVAYDSSALQFKDAVKGSLNSNVLFESNNVGSTVKISFAGKSGFSGSGSIAVLTFRVIGQNGASSPITVTVGGASTSGGKSVTIPVDNGKVSIGNSNPNDPGGRGKVTSLDALIALQISVGKRPTDTNYDITKDGTVNSNDAREILKLAVQ